MKVTKTLILFPFKVFGKMVIFYAALIILVVAEERVQLDNPQEESVQPEDRQKLEPSWSFDEETGQIVQNVETPSFQPSFKKRYNPTKTQIHYGPMTGYPGK